jgi:hypothetical protein
MIETTRKILINFLMQNLRYVLDKRKLAGLFEEIEDENVRVSVYMPSSLKVEIEKAAEFTGKSVNQVVVQILKKFFEA